MKPPQCIMGVKFQCQIKYANVKDNNFDGNLQVLNKTVILNT